MNGESSPKKQVPIEDIFSASLCDYAQHTAFPWDPDRPLNGSAVGSFIFRDHDAVADWDVPEVKEALMKLGEIGIDNIHLDDFPDFVRAASVEDGELSAWERNAGILLTLDQGARYLCKGTNARYVYDFFEIITTHTVKSITGRGMARLSDWEMAGMDRNQAIIRALAMIGTLAHSEKPEDHEWNLTLTEKLRKEYESLTHTHDPYRKSQFQDLANVNLYGQLCEEGPPQGKGVHMHDFVYWLMRYYASQIAYMRHWGRSPFRNVAVGRDDQEGEVAWLRSVGVERTEEDEEVRLAIKEDVESGRWRPLEL